MLRCAPNDIYKNVHRCRLWRDYSRGWRYEIAVNDSSEILREQAGYS